MTVVGAFARIAGDVKVADREINALTGLTTFFVDEPGVVGILVEADTVDDAHHIINQTLPALPGILGVWPVYMGLEDESP